MARPQHMAECSAVPYKMKAGVESVCTSYGRNVMLGIGIRPGLEVPCRPPQGGKTWRGLAETAASLATGKPAASHSIA